MKIAIDGPSGSGKSTLAKTLAKRLNIYYLDTGSMYRSAAYAAVQTGIDVSDESAVAALMNRTVFLTEYENGEQQNYVDGVNVMPFIRTPEISKAASDISAHPCVRYKLVDMQRQVSQNYDIVLDGRDIGTFVLPDADYKFYITAEAAERAKRRFLEDADKNTGQTLDEVLMDMKQRDYNDANRGLAPLKQADDAILIDTTDLSIDEVVCAILKYLN
ncbi:MAG: (d)CMP kinase [Clostridia bacterium]|jgi:CMP/dCMP kinase|nr:(d)CMP kinase [Clostridia bacterium]MBT7123343.1 (d)CMP kinase [Clostridia bacterium]